MAERERVGYEITISVFEPFEKVEELFDHLTDQVCEFYGGHEEIHSDPEECETYYDGCNCGECPVMFTSGMGPIYADEEE